MKAVGAQHFLFDFDGTLVDSAPLHEWAFKEALAIAAPWGLADFNYSKLRGLSTRDAFLHLGINNLDVLELCTLKKQKVYRSAVRAGRLVLFHHARALLRAVLAFGGDNYLVTSGSPQSVNLALDQLDLGALFAGIVTSDDVAAGKPAPDPYLICLSRFGLSAADSIAVEDAQAGVLSAQGAELPVIGVHDSSIASCVDFYFPTLLALGYALCKGGHLHQICMNRSSTGYRRLKGQET